MGELLFFGAVLVGLLWLVIGWRAMRAHERLAAQAERYIDMVLSRERMEARRENDPNQLYRQFRSEHPELEAVTSKERHDKFREWMAGKGDPKPGE